MQAMWAELAGSKRSEVAVFGQTRGGITAVRAGARQGLDVVLMEPWRHPVGLVVCPAARRAFEARSVPRIFRMVQLRG